MKIETTHEVESLNAKDARLKINVIVDGKSVGAPIVVASGPKVHIEDYVAGNITLDELGARILRIGNRDAR